MVNKFKQREDGSILIPEFRVSFPHIFDKGMDGKYGVGMMFPKDSTDMTFLEALIETTIKEKWGSKRPKILATPILDGDESDREERAGFWYINGKGGKYAPALVNTEKDDILDPEEFYAGCWARAVGNLYTYERRDVGKFGVSLSVRSIQKLRDDVPLVSRVSAQDDFDELPSGGDDL